MASGPDSSAVKHQTTAADFEAEFVKSRSDLLSFLFRLTCNLQDAEDLLQDTFLRGRKRIETFEGRSTLRTWMFTIAGNLARDHSRAKRRWREDAQDLCRTRTQAIPDRVAVMREHVRNSPSDKYEFKEHIDYCFSCISKTLEIEKQIVILLKDVYAFRISEIIEILGLTEGRVKHLLADGRATMVRIFDDRCVLVSKKGACHQCSEMNGFVNPGHDAQQRAVEASIAAVSSTDGRRKKLYDLRTALVRSVDPLNVPGTDLHAYLLELMDEWPR